MPAYVIVGVIWIYEGGRQMHVYESVKDPTTPALGNASVFELERPSAFRLSS